jgi:hypothetical protein
MGFSSFISQPLSSSLSVMKRNVSAKRSELCLDSSKIRLDHRWSFIGGSRISVQSNSYTVVHKKFSGVRASWLTTTQIASSVFAVGTTAVLPFYTLMVVAPKAEIVSLILLQVLQLDDLMKLIKIEYVSLCRPRSVWRVAYRISS